MALEEENYVRIALLLTGISPRAVRIKFDSEFSPVCLERTLRQATKDLRDLKNKKVINQHQWNLLFPTTGKQENEPINSAKMHFSAPLRPPVVSMVTTNQSLQPVS